MTLKKKAQQVRRVGSENSNQDSMLAHISPREATLLKLYGGSGRKDPQTGLPHYDDPGDPGIGDPGVADGIGVPAGDTPSGDTSGFSDFSNIDFSGFLGNEGNFGFANGDPSAISEGVTTPDIADQPTEDTIISKMFKGLLSNQVTGQIGHAVGMPSLPGISAITGAVQGNQPATPSQALGNFSSMGLGMLGGLFGGIPGIVGGLAGQAIGSNISAPPAMSGADISAANAATSDPSNSSGQNMQSDFLNGPGLANMGGLLGQLYNSNQQSKLYGGTMDTINNLYSPNSPYAQQMRQAMERKDAAAGRRSQYGTREMQLAAALTQARSNALTSPGYGAMLKGQAGANQQLPAYLLSLAKTNWGQSMLGKAGRGISDWYAGNNNSNYSNEGMNYPSYNGGGGGGTFDGGNYSNEGSNYTNSGAGDIWNNGWGEG